MGIYLFDANFLYEQLLLDADIPESSKDFGRDVIPRLVSGGEDVFVHHFRDSCINLAHGEPYWRDVGTVDAYFERTSTSPACCRSSTSTTRPGPSGRTRSSFPRRNSSSTTRAAAAWRSTRSSPAAAS
jgi:NDP-sugar pyrophosphorylase family protein